jgi:hypothetical protein
VMAFMLVEPPQVQLHLPLCPASKRPSFSSIAISRRRRDGSDGSRRRHHSWPVVLERWRSPWASARGAEPPAQQQPLTAGNHRCGYFSRRVSAEGAYASVVRGIHFSQRDFEVRIVIPSSQFLRIVAPQNAGTVSCRCNLNKMKSDLRQAKSPAFTTKGRAGARSRRGVRESEELPHIDPGHKHGHTKEKPGYAQQCEFNHCGAAAQTAQFAAQKILSKKNSRLWKVFVGRSSAGLTLGRES